MTDSTHLLGLLLGTEEDWPRAFESLVRRLDPALRVGGQTHRYDVERITIEPFDLRQPSRYALVVDRLAYWYYVPREWLKKVALVDDVYLLNNPFTFQAMEKHAAYCAMIRLGLKVPTTWLVPHKEPPDNPRFPYTAQRYNQPFDLNEVAGHVGYPLYMKPYDGGAWVGVSRIRDEAELVQAYDESGQRLMHLQASVEGFDIFARSLSVGAETMVMRFDPAMPMHDRYTIDHSFLTPDIGSEVVTIGKVVNAFFRWEFNSCETLIRGGQVHPIDYANACPDVSITSLHYYFPWAMIALVKWSMFCTATGRRPRSDLDTRRWFDVADSGGSYDEKIATYRTMADEYFQAEQYDDFVSTHLANLPEVAHAYFGSPDFDQLIVETIQSTFPQHEHDKFIAHYRGLLGTWVADAAPGS